MVAVYVLESENNRTRHQESQPMYATFLLSARYLNEGHPVADCRTTDYLRQEIAFFETRLHEMGEQGDCAYERALSRTYEVLLRERRVQLAQLHA